jgi:hypothetical protein
MSSDDLPVHPAIFGSNMTGPSSVGAARTPEPYGSLEYRHGLRTAAPLSFPVRKSSSAWFASSSG